VAAPKRNDSKPRPRASTSGPEAFLSSPAGLFVVAGLAVVVVAALVLANGGVPMPTAEPPTLDPALVPTPDLTAQAGAGASDVVTRPLTAAALVMCNGAPCPSRGPEDAKVTLVEVSDYGCTHCKDFQDNIAPIIEREYVDTGRLRWVSHPFGFGASTQNVAAAAMCANDQGAYFAFQSKAFARDLVSKGADIEQGIQDVGREAVPDYAKFEQCVKAKTYFGDILLLSMEAQNAGVMYTPTIVINDLTIEGAEDISVFRSRIDRLLGEAGS
jgi:protein-disulfide isomerase